MTGIVNSTGARSGIIGTTVGTPAAGGRLKAIDSYWTNAATNINQTGGGSALDDINVSGAHYVTIIPDATTDILEFSYDFNIWGSGLNSSSAAIAGRMGWGLQKSETVDGTGLTGSLSSIWRKGQNTVTFYPNQEYKHAGGTFVITASEAGMSAETTYYVRLTGETAGDAGNWTWGNTATSQLYSNGIRLLIRRWSAA